MFAISGHVVAGESMEGYIAGPSYAIIAFVLAPDAEAACDIAWSELEKLGWATFSPKAAKELDPDGKFDDQARQSYEAALRDGHHFQIYTQPITN